jgi:uncharacterized membrane protein YsdA (DUF1294 family)/cold shock CspA family protein
MFKKSLPENPGNLQIGTIVEWVDAKGYGWVEAGGTRLFVHIKDFERGQRRPQAGEEVRFIPGIDSKGRSCAKQAALVKSGGRVRIGGWLLLCCLLVLPVVAMQWLPLPWWIGVVAMGVVAMGVVSAITYGMYAYDKQQAIAGEWRVPEATLHFAELLGGWPGAYLAQRWLRHKCSKASYQVVFWGIVVLFQIAAADVMLGHQLSRELMNRLIR